MNQIMQIILQIMINLNNFILTIFTCLRSPPLPQNFVYVPSTPQNKSTESFQQSFPPFT